VDKPRITEDDLWKTRLERWKKQPNPVEKPERLWITTNDCGSERKRTKVAFVRKTVDNCLKTVDNRVPLVENFSKNP
jgi:hypothetical protein